jgi:signal transduction histidine kinase/CheY-like chemotaxis protein
MLRKFRIGTRLLISFFILVLFTLIVGITGFISLINTGSNAYIILGLVFLSLVVSIILAVKVTRSISLPLSQLEVFTDKVINDELDFKIEQSRNDDEIAHLSYRLRQTMQQLHKAQELKLEAMNAQHEKEKAEASARSKSEFLAKMSHEIRTPMNAITGMTELALREEMSAAARERIVTIKQASINLLSIINDILDFSKIESGKLDIVPVDYSFSTLVNDVINIIKMRVTNPKICFVVNVDSKIPNALSGDETRIRQILLNILSNAVKYTKEGFVSLNIVGEIYDSLVYLTIEVADSGRGIKREDIDKLFGNFVQVDIKDNRGIEGTGLGLAITHGLVKAMNGEISVESEYGKGSLFTVKLPQKIRDNKPLASVYNPQNKQVLVYETNEHYSASIIRTIKNLDIECKLALSSREFSQDLGTGKYKFIFITNDLYSIVKDICLKYKFNTKLVLLTGSYETTGEKNANMLTMPAYCAPVADILNGVTVNNVSSDTGSKIVIKFVAPDVKILVVDDIATNLKVAEGLLTPYKLQIDSCRSGHEAIRAVQNKKYDIVFMDHMMPEMDGIETVGYIREWESRQNGAKLVIIALTANALSGMSEMFMSKGFNDFLPKPIDVFKLDEILSKWIPKDKKEWGAANVLFDSAPKQASKPFPAITGIDTARGITTSGGTESGYLTVLSTFLRDTKERLPFLQREPAQTNIDDFVFQYHAIKGAAAAIGALDLSKEAAILEDAGRKWNLSYIKKAHSPFLEHITALVKNIQAALGTIKNNEKNDIQKPDNQEKIQPLILKLQEALKTQNIVKIDEFLAELLKKQLAPKTREILERVSEDVLVTEFDNAAAKIKEIFPDKN